MQDTLQEARTFAGAPQNAAVLRPSPAAPAQQSLRGALPALAGHSGLRPYILAFLVFLGASLLNLQLESWIGYQAVALVYLLAIVLLARAVERGPILFGTALTALGWSFVFVPPKYSFHIAGFYDKMMLMIYFAVALSIGQLTARLRAEREMEHRRERSSAALYQLARELPETENEADLLKRAAAQAGGVFDAQIGFLLPMFGGKGSLGPVALAEWCDRELERGAAQWAFEHNEPAGRGMDTRLGAEALYLPLCVGASTVGVMTAKLKPGARVDTQQLRLLENFARQVALLLDRQRLRQAGIEARLLAESERLGRTLLNSVSHELRTPIAAIMSGVSTMQTSGALNPTQERLSAEIESAAARLNRVVQSLLSAARLQVGQVRPNLDWCDVPELLRVSLRQASALLAEHRVTVRLEKALPLVKADSVLLDQALTNLLANAAVHTPPGTAVEVGARREGSELWLEVADRGPGLPPDQIERIFDLFHRSPSAQPGGTGLGLAIVKGFIEAQGGRVRAANRPGGGAVFGLGLPLSEPPNLPEETS